MDWTVFMFALLDWLAKCLEDRRRDQVEAEMLNPGFASRRGARVLLREQGYHGRKLREETDEAIAYLREQDAEDVNCLLDLAELRLAKAGRQLYKET